MEPYEEVRQTRLNKSRRQLIERSKVVSGRIQLSDLPGSLFT